MTFGAVIWLLARGRLTWVLETHDLEREGMEMKQLFRSSYVPLATRKSDKETKVFLRLLVITCDLAFVIS